MRDTVARLVGRNLHYPDLIADNGLSSGARTLRLHTAQQRPRERFAGRARWIAFAVECRRTSHSGGSSDQEPWF